MKIFVKPAPGLMVRHPVTGCAISSRGIEVSDTDPYWHRRLLRKDVVLATEDVVTKTQISDSVSPRKGKE